MQKIDKSFLEFKFQIWNAIVLHSWEMENAFLVDGMMEKSELSSLNQEN